jgi:glycosyltransferase involved in cell wall biosynthesis
LDQRTSSEGRLRIAVVIHALAGGGAQRDTILLCNALVERGCAVSLLALHDKGVLASLLDPRIDIVTIPGRQVRYALPGLIKVLRDVAPGVVLSSEASLNVLSLAAVRLLRARLRPKLVMREVSSPTPAQADSPNFQNRVAYGLLRRLYRYADRIVTLTDGAKQDLVDNFSVAPAQISVMRINAVVAPDTVERLARWDGEAGRDPNLIVSVGRLSREKGHMSLLQAVAQLDRDRPWRLALVGDGDERQRLERFAHENGVADRIVFAGYQPDPFSWLMRARVAVIPSRYEGFGNAIVEALACGTPVVATDCPYGPREILADGEYGTLVPVGDAPALASAIRDALGRPADRTRLRVRGLAYTSERAAASFLDIVADLHPQGVRATKPQPQLAIS